MAERPLHPSLPIAPHARAGPSNTYTQSSPMPFPSQYRPVMSSHYAQAYMNFPTLTAPTPRGIGSFGADPSLIRHNAFGSKDGQSSQAGIAFHTSAAWYQPGNSKCTFKGCSFIASHKTLEIHMMDRHLIYPPGWEKRQKKQHDWDADPSLKGKPIPIQGTMLTLDSPEVVEAWIAERKKRWPTSSRVEEKKRKMEEAIARGQLSVGDNSLRKKRRVDRPLNGDHKDQRGRHSAVNPVSRDCGTDSGWRGRVATMSPGNTQHVPSTPLCPDDDTAIITPHPDADADVETDTGPEVASTKQPLVDTQPPTIVSLYTDGSRSRRAGIKHNIMDLGVRKTRKAQSVKKEPYNPFASRPTLLRNLLLPEIRVTISNLSQAIRFLADNNFLHGVELKVGEANKRMIEVMSDSMATPQSGKS